jgi:membrane protease YdiL (CAAX protease family)
MTTGEGPTVGSPVPGRPTPDVAAPYLAGTGWTFPDVLLALLGGIAGAIVAVLALGPVSGEIGVRELAATLGAQAVATMTVVAALGGRRGSGVWWRDLGLRFRPVDLWGLLGGVGLQIGVALLVAPLLRIIDPDPPRQSIVETAEQMSGVGARLLFIGLVVVVAPLIEEIVFRGMLLSRLRRAMGPWAAIAVSAAAFAALHPLLDPDAIFAAPGLFLIGLVLGWAALRTGDIGLAIMLHAGVNLTGVLLILLAEDILDAVEALARVVPG